jgi:hypothetical protein
VSPATLAAPDAARPAHGGPDDRLPPALTPRRIGLVRSTWDGLVPHGAPRVAAALHAALGDLAARARPERRAAAAEGRRLLRLLPVAVEACGAPLGRFATVVAAALRWMPDAEATEHGDEDLLREALLRTPARFLGADGAGAETRAAWVALCAATEAPVGDARTRRRGDRLPRAA